MVCNVCVFRVVYSGMLLTTPRSCKRCVSRRLRNDDGTCKGMSRTFGVSQCDGLTSRLKEVVHPSNDRDRGARPKPSWVVWGLAIGRVLSEHTPSHHCIHINPLLQSGITCALEGGGYVCTHVLACLHADSTYFHEYFAGARCIMNNNDIALWHIRNDGRNIMALYSVG
jgi:hypothetical protein